MIHLYATYDHQRIHGTARALWYAVAYLERKSERGMWYCAACDAFADSAKAMRHWEFRADDYIRGRANNYLAIVEAKPDRHDSIIRNLELEGCATDLRILNVVSICNHLRREARIAAKAITELRAQERVYRDQRTSYRTAATVRPNADSGANEHFPGHKQAGET